MKNIQSNMNYQNDRIVSKFSRNFPLMVIRNA
ncbi:unnamed protein product [Onchocerca flexuosa]|uniref:Transposase n=1 Tax=Onchocerca flexuosa TaxID=387005 RepID=A0A183HNE1_9BILA|nr:unnamed protein product [Onchocerca flexuosa]